MISKTLRIVYLVRWLVTNQSALYARRDISGDSEGDGRHSAQPDSKRRSIRAFDNNRMVKSPVS